MSNMDRYSHYISKQTENPLFGSKNAKTTIAEETKDSREYDYEGEMVLNQLEQMTHHIAELKDLVKPNTNLPEWVQSKITLANDYIQTAADYLKGEMKEEVELDESDDGWYTHHEMYGKISKENWKKGWRYNHLKSKPFYHQPSGKWHSSIKEEVEQVDEIAPVIAAIASRAIPAIVGSAARSAATRAGAGALGRGAAELAGKTLATKAISSMTPNSNQSNVKEETGPSYEEELPHILKDIRSKKKSHSDLRREYGSNWKRLANATAAEHGHDYNRSHLLAVGQKHMGEQAEQIDELSKDTLKSYMDKKRVPSGTVVANINDKNSMRKYTNRVVGGVRAAKRLMAKEEAEQIDELSKATMGRYINKAAERMSTQGTIAGMKIKDNESAKRNFKSIDKRQKGIKTAVDKLTKEDQDFIDSLNNDLFDEIATNEAAGDITVKNVSPADAYKKHTGQMTSKSKVPVDPKTGKTLYQKVTSEENKFYKNIVKKLEEGRGRPPKEGSAAWHRQQSEKKPAEEPKALGMQLRKAASINAPVTFDDGKSHQVHPSHVDKFHDHMDARKTTQEKHDFQKRASKSHEAFKAAVSEPLPNSRGGGSEVVKYR